MSTGGGASGGVALAGARAQFADAQLSRQAVRGRRVVRDLLEGGVDEITVLLDVIAAGQREVGRRWQQDLWSVADEHAATGVATAGAHVVADWLHDRPAVLPDRGRVVVACVEREWHALPALLVALALRADGWDAQLVGPGVSVERLGQHLLDDAPHVVAVSATVIGSLPRAQAAIAAATDLGIPVAAGGAAFGADGRRATTLEAQGWAADARDCVLLVRGLSEVAGRSGHGADRPDAARFPAQRVHGVGAGPGPVLAVARAEQAALEVDRLCLHESLASQWSLAADVLSAGRDERDSLATLGTGLIDVALDAVGAALCCDDPSIVGETSAWIRDVLEARGVPASMVSELGTALSRCLREYPLSCALVEQWWVRTASGPER